MDPFFKVNVELVIVAGFIVSLNVALSAMAADTLIAPFAGTVEVTVGGTWIGIPPESGPGFVVEVICNTTCEAA
jgi:hypothetical protein